MKTIFKDGKYLREEDKVADFKVDHQGWQYKSKSEWKKNSRDKVVLTEEVKEEIKQSITTKEKKKNKHSKIKSKQRQLEGHEKIFLK